MRLFSRRRGIDGPRDFADATYREQAHVASRPSSAAPVEELSGLPLGTYVTDGRTLFRIEHVVANRVGHDPMVELEDCRTLELILCPAGGLAALELHVVTPREAAAGHMLMSRQARSEAPSLAGERGA